MTYIKSTMACLVLGFILLQAGLLSAHEVKQAKISVTGSAVTLVDPDTTNWQVNVRSQGKESEAVSKLHTQRLKKLLSFLRAEGIKDDKIKTQRMNLSEDWDYSNNKRQKRGYIASGSVSFSSDIKSYLDLWSGLSKVDGININNTHFTLENQIPIQKTTRIKALKAAKSKAKTMVEALDASLGKPIYIEDLSYSDDVRTNAQPRKMMRSSMADAALMETADVVSAGKLEIRMRVKVAFEIN